MQVEYAMEAINNAGSTVGVLCPEGIVIGAERKQTSKLLERAKYSEKMYQIDSHLVCAAAGLTAEDTLSAEDFGLLVYPFYMLGGIQSTGLSFIAQIRVGTI